MFSVLRWERATKRACSIRFSSALSVIFFTKAVYTIIVHTAIVYVLDVRQRRPVLRHALEKADGFFQPPGSVVNCDLVRPASIRSVAFPKRHSCISPVFAQNVINHVHVLQAVMFVVVI